MKNIKIDYRLLTVLLGIVLIRLIFFWGASLDWQRTRLIDSRAYLELAQNMLENGVFSRSSQPPYIPDAARTPGYPFFLALIMGIFGKGNYAAIIIFQLVISLLIGMLIYRTILGLFGRNSAYFAGWLYAFDLPSSAYSIYIHTETLFTILLLFSFTTLLGFLRSKRRFYLYTSGLFGGLAALCRPIALYFFIPAVIIILVSFRSTRFLRRLKYAGIWLLIFFILVGGWSTRNSLQTGVWIFSTAQGGNLFLRAYHTIAQAEGVRPSKDFKDALNKRLPEELKLIDKNLYSAEKAGYRQQYTLEVIRKYPRDFLIVELMGATKLLFSPGRITVGRLLGLTPLGASTDVLGTVSSQEVRRAFRMIFISTSHLLWIAGINWMYLIVVYGLAVHGIPFLYQHKRRLLFSLLLVLFYLILLSSGPESDSRFRVPMMPYILILAGAGISKMQAVKGKTFNK